MSAFTRDPMKHFTVCWMLDVQAENHEEAAHAALAIQRNPAAIATYFQVRDNVSGAVKDVDAQCAISTRN